MEDVEMAVAPSAQDKLDDAMELVDTNVDGAVAALRAIIAGGAPPPPCSRRGQRCDALCAGRGPGRPCACVAARARSHDGIVVVRCVSSRADNTDEASMKAKEQAIFKLGGVLAKHGCVRCAATPVALRSLCCWAASVSARRRWL
jgi:hypothetical protein